MTTATVKVELVFATPEKQVLREFDVPIGSSVADVIAHGRLEREFPGMSLDDAQAGIWGQPVGRDRIVREGDRIELYRPLEIDPREARRLKAGI